MDARFSLTGEHLAFTPDPAAGEHDYPALYATPHPAVLTALRSASDRPHLWQTLPRTLDGQPPPRNCGTSPVPEGSGRRPADAGGHPPPPRPEHAR
ncbi:hypothetical protein SHKM778_58020 [Streptomyces sp. KM77-8]|uniref:Uncharacterized protein n=1 Tax=Streptomyces haneummycinicus TaxID=3074435 RepID=A0AAT9HQF4_9ACTN